MNNIRRFSIWDLLPIVLCIYLCSAQLAVFFPFIKSLVILGIGVLFTYVRYKQYYFSKHHLWLFVYVLVLLANWFSGDYTFQRVTNIIEEMFLLLFPAALCYYIIKKKKTVLAKSLVITFFVYIIYSTIATFIVDLVFPDAVRTSVYWSNHEDTEFLNLYYGLGMVPYKFPHALPIIIPGLVFILKNHSENKFFKLLTFLTLFSILFLIYLSNAATPLFMALVIFLFSVIIKEGNNRTNIARVFMISFLFIPLLFNSNFFVELLDYIGSLFGGDTKVFTERFEDIQSYSNQGNSSGDMGSRVNKYSISLSLFTENILIGTNKVTGEHSVFLDHLASLGLLGFIPYITYILILVSKIKGLMLNKISAYFYLGAAAALMLLATKNMNYWDTWFMFLCVLPVLLWITSYDSRELDQKKQKNCL